MNGVISRTGIERDRKTTVVQRFPSQSVEHARKALGFIEITDSPGCGRGIICLRPKADSTLQLHFWLHATRGDPNRSFVVSLSNLDFHCRPGLSEDDLLSRFGPPDGVQERWRTPPLRSPAKYWELHDGLIKFRPGGSRNSMVFSFRSRGLVESPYDFYRSDEHPALSIQEVESGIQSLDIVRNTPWTRAFDDNDVMVKEVSTAERCERNSERTLRC